MRVSEVEYLPEFKLLLATNHRPLLNTNDPALMERVVTIPFDYTIPVSERNRDFLDELLAEEQEGILTWLVQGSVRWANEGLGRIPVDDCPTPEVGPQSTVEHFVGTCCVVGDGLRCGSTALYCAYLIYHDAIADGSDPVPSGTFFSDLDKSGFKVKHERTGNDRLGIALKTL